VPQDNGLETDHGVFVDFDAIRVLILQVDIVPDPNIPGNLHPAHPVQRRAEAAPARQGAGQRMKRPVKKAAQKILGH
jgi:hypothetical protein